LCRKSRWFSPLSQNWIVISLNRLRTYVTAASELSVMRLAPGDTICLSKHLVRCQGLVYFDDFCAQCQPRPATATGTSIMQVVQLIGRLTCVIFTVHNSNSTERARLENPLTHMSTHAQLLTVRTSHHRCIYLHHIYRRG